MTLDGLTISGGQVGNPADSNQGAGLYASAGTAGATLTGCTFTGNAGGNGGGAHFSGTTATLTGCTFTGNAGGNGGGAHFSGTIATLTACTFTGNAGGNGGGAHFSETTATLTACTFTGNEAVNDGGGAYFAGKFTLTNCVFVGNEARDGHGGGLFFNSGGTVINSTLYNNTATGGQGGGVYVRDSSFMLQNSILVGNTATDAASGHQVYVGNTDVAHVATLQNNLIAGGADPMGTDQGIVYTTPGAGNITQENTVDEPDVAVVFASTDPMNANYLRLADGSPAVDAGNNLYLNNGTPDDIKTDAAGNARIQGGTVDLGAYESNPPPNTIMLTSHTDGDSIAIAYDEVVAQTIMFSIGGNATGWTSAITGDDFITLDTDMNVAQDTGVAITVRATPTENTGVERSAAITITITTTGGGPVASATVTITQAALPDYIYLGDITVTTQTEVDSLRTTLAGKTVVNGNVTIGTTIRGSQTHITDLSPLSNLTHITKNLYIQQNGQLKNLNALANLQTIGGFFIVDSNGRLTALGDFSALQTIGGFFIVDSNGRLTALGDFSALQTIGGFFNVRDNNELTALGDFPALTSIGIGNEYVPSLGQTIDSVSIVVEDNPSLSDCYVLTDFLPGGAHAVYGGIYINDNALGCNSRDEIIAVVPHMIMLTSHTDGESIAIAYDEVTAQTIAFNVGGSATGWIATSDQDFVRFSSAEGDSGRNIEVVATPTKNTGVERVAVITLSTLGPESTSVTATLMIVQGGAPPVLILTSEDRDTLAYDAQTASDITFTLGGATGWRHEITYSGTSEAFITLTGDTTMSGDIRVVVASEVNMGMERTATITIKTEGSSGAALDTMITIVQATSPPVLRLISSNKEVIAHDRITVKNIIFDVGGSATGWEVSVVEDDNNFLTVDRTMGVPGENIVVEARSRSLNVGVERSAVVRIRAMRGVGVVVDTFVTITQMGAVPTLSVGNLGGSIAYNSTEATINFSIGGGATGWKVSSIRSQTAEENFITSPEVGEIRHVRGDQRLSITLEENRGLQRLAVITLETVGGTSNAVSTDFLILQDAAPPTLRLTSIDSAFISHDVTRLRDITFEVGGGATGWRAEVIEGSASNNFLTLSNNRGSSGLDRIRVDVRNNLGLSRTGRIAITTVGGAGSALDTVITIRQGSAPPTLTLISSDREDLAYDAKKANDIAFTLGGGATGWSSDITYSEGSEAFITLTGEEDERGDVRVVVASEVNTGMERTATITIKTEGGSGDALDTMITIVQELVPTISVTTPTEDISIAYDEGSSPDDYL